MILLDWGRTTRHPPGVALIFGTGLIGGTICDALQRKFPNARKRRMPWSWSSLGINEAEDIEAAAKAILTADTDAHFATIWSAGSSGFGTDKVGMNAELAAFEAVLTLSKKIGRFVPDNQRSFIHTSSAGGLFEGQIACGKMAQPAPLRPYGEGKLAQEQLVEHDESLGQRYVLRPSSVYGYAASARRGLLAVLAAAALKRHTATIMGALTTQRDYIYAPDIGRFVANLVMNVVECPAAPKVQSMLLASGRPATIFEIINIIENRLDRPLLVKIDPKPDNARHNTFLTSALPTGFRPTSLHEGVALTVSLVSHGLQTGAKL